MKKKSKLYEMTFKRGISVREFRTFLDRLKQYDDYTLEIFDHDDEFTIEIFNYVEYTKEELKKQLYDKIRAKSDKLFELESKYNTNHIFQQGVIAMMKSEINLLEEEMKKLS